MGVVGTLNFYFATCWIEPVGKKIVSRGICKPTFDYENFYRFRNESTYVQQKRSYNLKFSSLETFPALEQNPANWIEVKPGYTVGIRTVTHFTKNQALCSLFWRLIYKLFAKFHSRLNELKYWSFDLTQKHESNISCFLFMSLQLL